MGPDDMQFGLVHTAAAHRGKGFARNMLVKILHDLGERGSCWWLTELENTPSRRLVESLSFVQTGVAIRKIGPTRIPYFVMAKDI